MKSSRSHEQGHPWERRIFTITLTAAWRRRANRNREKRGWERGERLKNGEKVSEIKKKNIC